MEFQHGMCTCYEDLGACAMGYFCPCVLAGKNAELMGENCILYGCLSITPYRIMVLSRLRGKIREKYGIEGGVCTDVLMHWCCPFCAIIQEYREIKAHGDPPDAVAMARE